MTALPDRFGGDHLTGSAAEVYEAAKDGPTMRFTIKRERIQPGRTISREAMEQAMVLLTAFIEARIMLAWDQRNEPPTVVTIDITVEAQ